MSREQLSVGVLVQASPGARQDWFVKIHSITDWRCEADHGWVVAEVPGLAVVQVLLVQEEGEAVLPPLVLVAWPVLAGPALWAWAGPADVISLYVIIAQSTVTQLHSDHAHHMPSVLTPGLTQYNYILSWDPSGSEHVPPLQTEDTSPYSNTLLPSSHGKQKLQL